MSRISEDVNKVRMYLGPAFLYGFNLISLFIVVIFTMFKVNATLAFYTLLPLPLLSLIIYKVSNLINQRSEKSRSNSPESRALPRKLTAGSGSSSLSTPLVTGSAILDAKPAGSGTSACSSQGWTLCFFRPCFSWLASAPC